MVATSIHAGAGQASMAELSTSLMRSFQQTGKSYGLSTTRQIFIRVVFGCPTCSF